MHVENDRVTTAAKKGVKVVSLIRTTERRQIVLRSIIFCMSGQYRYSKDASDAYSESDFF